MKLHTDFVTNSSSSSFIFNENTTEKDIKVLLRKLKKRAENSRYDDYMTGDVKLLSNGIKDASKLSVEGANEILCWYSTEIEDVTDINLDKAEILFDMAEHIYSDWRTGKSEDIGDIKIKDLMPKIKEKLIFEESTENGDVYSLGYNIITDEDLKEFDRISDMFNTLDKLFVHIFKCKYIFYNDRPIWTDLADIIEDECKYHCNHMG